jgi:hypothetical protein
MLTLARSRLLTFTAALVGCANAARAQNVIVVDAAGGPGSDYTSLVAAVAAAIDGDILLLRSGIYANPGSKLSISKGLVMQADRGHHVEVRTPVVLDALGPSQPFTWRGIDLVTDVMPFGLDLQIKNCSGAVRIADAAVHPVTSLKVGGVRVEGSSDAAFSNCAIQPSPAQGFGSGDRSSRANGSSRAARSTRARSRARPCCRSRSRRSGMRAASRCA